MIDPLVEKVSGFLDRRFLIAYWMPSCIALTVVMIYAARLVGVIAALTWWKGRDTTDQILAGIGLLLVTTILAYMLQALTDPLVRSYEGYLPRWLSVFSRLGRHFEERRYKSFKATNPNDYQILYIRFPRNSAQLRSTQLGNTLTAAEEYAYQIYRLDSVIWWPRLTPLLPDAFRLQLDVAMTQLFALLNLSTLFVVSALAIGTAEIYLYGWSWFIVGLFCAGLIIARICYRAALDQGASYGMLIRVAFDLYRYEILKQMRIDLPTSLADERALWDALNQWIYRYIPPTLSDRASQLQQPSDSTTSKDG